MLNIANAKRAKQIAQLNDHFRKTTKEVHYTPGIFNCRDVLELTEAVRLFTNFNDNNDPWGEHDFGSFMWEGRRVFWKIDYYDSQLRQYKDPLSVECKRILTVMLASEY